MIVLDRDIEVLKSILRYKYITSDQVHDLYFSGNSKTTTNRSLKRLEDLGFIGRFKFPKNKGQSSGDMVYLKEKGAQFLADEEDITLEDIGFKVNKNPDISIRFFLHRKMCIDFWIALDQDLEGQPFKLKKVAIDHRRMIRDGKQIVETKIATSDGIFALIPDLYFILTNETGDKERLFFVEIDRGTETIGEDHSVGLNQKPTTLLGKYRFYEEIWDQAGWQQYIKTNAQAYTVLTVTTTTTRIEGIRKKVRNALRWPKMFYLTTHEQIKTQGVVSSKNWLTLDHDSQWQLLV